VLVLSLSFVIFCHHYEHVVIFYTSSQSTPKVPTDTQTGESQIYQMNEPIQAWRSLSEQEERVIVRLSTVNMPAEVVTSSSYLLPYFSLHSVRTVIMETTNTTTVMVGQWRRVVRTITAPHPPCCTWWHNIKKSYYPNSRRRYECCYGQEEG